MAGTLKLVGEGRWTTRDVERALKAKDRTACGPVAPASGLYLVRIDYPPEFALEDQLFCNWLISIELQADLVGKDKPVREIAVQNLRQVRHIIAENRLQPARQRPVEWHGGDID